MKRKVAVVIGLCLTLCGCVAAPVPDMAAVVAKLPADGSAEGQKIAAELVATGPEGIKAVCQKLVPPGTADDAKEQQALSGLAMYVSRPGAEAERRMFAEVLIEQLQTASNNEVKAFFIRQLQLVGKDEAVGPLSKLLTDERLCDPATQALLAIRMPKAQGALADALATAKGARRVIVIRALAELAPEEAARRRAASVLFRLVPGGVKIRTKEVVRALIKDTASEDANIRRAALYALANMGAPSAVHVLAKATQAESPFERATATSFYLLLARRLAEDGHKDACVKICRDLLAARAAPQEANVQCAALSRLVATLGKEALDDLLAAMDSPNKEIREAAVELACALPGEDVTAKCVEKLPAASLETRVALVAMLGRRGDKSALPALLEALKDTEKDVRRAAITASAKLGGNDAIPSLLAVFETDQADDIKAAQEVLARLPGDEVLNAVAAALPKVPPPSRVALLNVLATRRAKAHVEVVFSATKDEDKAVRQEAIKALGNVADEKDIPRVVDLMLTVQDGGERGAAQKSVATAARRIADAERRADSLLTRLVNANKDQRTVILRTLAQVGGKKALERVLADAKSADADIQDAAVRSLADWQDMSASAELLKLARGSAKETHQVLALRGYVRLASAAENPAHKKLAMFKDAMAAAKRPDEKKLVLAGLSSVETLESLELVAPYLDDESLRNEAVAAVVKIACPRDRRDKGLTAPEVAPILKKILAHTQDANLRRQVEEQLGRIPKPPPQAQAPQPAPPPDAQNLARGKPVKTSVTQQGDKKPELAVDGNAADVNSAWFGAKWPSWFQVDLQKPSRTDAVQVFFYWDGARYYQYTVEISLDGEKWTKVADTSQNTMPSSPRGVLHTFPVAEARYVRLNILKNSANEAVHLVELKVFAEGQAPKPPPPPKADAEGFIPLFNGKDITGWMGSVKGYRAENGVLICDEKLGGTILTEQEYGDFLLRFEFRLTPGANNGLAIRAPPRGNPAYEGMELQILDNTAEKYKTLRPHQFHGSIYGVVPAKREFLKAVGEWNSQEVFAQGPLIKVVLNGEVILEADLSKIEKPADGKEHPGIKRDKGHLGFMGHGAHVEFRNIRIKEVR